MNPKNILVPIILQFCGELIKLWIDGEAWWIYIPKYRRGWRAQGMIWLDGNPVVFALSRYQLDWTPMGSFSLRQPSPTANINSTVINTDATWLCWFSLRHPNVHSNARGHFEHAGKRAENEVGGHSVPPPLTNFLWKTLRCIVLFLDYTHV